jgi:hypothetical protein
MAVLSLGLGTEGEPSTKKPDRWVSNGRVSVSLGKKRLKNRFDVFQLCQSGFGGRFGGVILGVGVMRELVFGSGGDHAAAGLNLKSAAGSA